MTTPSRPLDHPSTITCPHCNHRSLEDMPTESCQIVYDCKGCGARLVAMAGECCVFCSFGDEPCPPRLRN